MPEPMPPIPEYHLKSYEIKVTRTKNQKKTIVVQEMKGHESVMEEEDFIAHIKIHHLNETHLEAFIDIEEK